MYNPAGAALVGIQANGIPYLRVSGRELAQWVHNDLGREVLNLPGLVVPFVQGSIRPGQIESHRPSYINALLIQSRGFVQDPPCQNCAVQLRPFYECRRVPGHFGGCCGNCKWRDHCSRCSAYNKDEEAVQVIDDDHLLEPPPGAGPNNPLLIE